MLPNMDEYLDKNGYQLTKMAKASLEAHYASRVQRGICLTFSELSNSTGMSLVRYIDFYVLHLYAMHSWLSVAYEVKVSRGDFFAELRDPQKREFALTVSNQFYFATPPRLVRPDEVPAEAGLVEVSAGGYVRVVKRAPERKREAAPWGFVAALARRAAKAPLSQEHAGTEEPLA